jgi:ABC-type sugar transport system permease subunit
MGEIMSKFFGNKAAIIVFAFPLLILYSTFVIFPIIPGIITSLQDNNGFANQGFVGLSNYIEIFQMPEFWKSNFNNLIIVLVSTLLGLPCSLFLALLIDAQSDRMRRFFKISSFMPAVLSVTVISQMWVAIYEPRWGLLNTLLQKIGLESLKGQWLSDEKMAIFCITFAFLWQFIGFNMLLFYTGIKSIPKSYYEAALIDGANYFQSSIKITIPLLQEVIKFLLLISILGCMAQFAHVRIMTNGGPGDASRTVVYQMYYTAFMQSEYGKGCAIAVMFIIECLIITLIINNSVAKKKLQY